MTPSSKTLKAFDSEKIFLRPWNPKGKEESLKILNQIRINTGLTLGDIFPTTRERKTKCVVVLGSSLFWLLERKGKMGGGKEGDWRREDSNRVSQRTWQNKAAGVWGEFGCCAWLERCCVKLHYGMLVWMGITRLLRKLGQNVAPKHSHSAICHSADPVSNWLIETFWFEDES